MSFLSSDHLIHMRCLLDFECAIVVVNVCYRLRAHCTLGPQWDFMTPISL